MNDGKPYYVVLTDPYPKPSYFLDGDMSYGESTTVWRTFLNFGAAGIARVLIKDQAGDSSKEGMKRCGYVEGKYIVLFEEALQRMEAKVTACKKYKVLMVIDSPLILARKDVRGSKIFANNGLQEGIWRCQAFRDAGANITFLESPQNQDEMKEYCNKVKRPKMANLIKGEKTPILAL